MAPEPEIPGEATVTSGDTEELPPPDTPEGRFERFCQAHPAACD